MSGLRVGRLGRHETFRTVGTPLRRLSFNGSIFLHQNDALLFADLSLSQWREKKGSRLNRSVQIKKTHGMSKMSIRRREALVVLTGMLCVPGCSGDSVSTAVSDAVEDVPTETLKSVHVGLRGFQLVAFMVGKRVVRLPHPAVRILGVALVSTALVSLLAIEYLDDELKRRQIREELSEDERSSIEAQLAVVFTTENGLDEQVQLEPNRYELEPV